MKVKNPYRRSFFKRLSRKTPVKVSMTILALILGIGIFADFIANEYPYYFRTEDQVTWPLFSSLAYDLGITGNRPAQIDYKLTKHIKAVFAPIPFTSKLKTDLPNRLKPPLFSEKIGERKYFHWQS